MEQADIWVLADDRAGNVGQCVGVAEALGMPFEVKNIRYNHWVKLPNSIRSNTLLGIDKKQSSTIKEPWPKLVIAAGRRTAPIARYIKRKSGGKTRLVQIMWPGKPSGDFDLIAVPSHDKKHQETNVFTITGSPNRITPKMLQEAEEKWQGGFVHLPQPLFALIVGGSTKKHEFTTAHAENLGKTVSAMVNEAGGSLLVTTSRRTSPEATLALLSALTCAFQLHDWTKGGENPYFGYLACAKALIVTGDSMSMCSEAVATGKPVYISAPADITSTKHARLHKELYNKGWAKPLGEDGGFWSYTPENPTDLLAKEIKNRYFS
jgi:mitochondrial fission protein ELM1